MTRECLNSKIPFGVTFLDEEGMRKIGCSARILEVLREYPDGRMDILCEGEGRFIIQNILTQKSYLEAEIQYYNDDAPRGRSELETLQSAGIDVVGQIFKLAGQQFLADHFQQMEAELFSFVFSFYADLPKPVRQEIIEMTDTTRRLQYLLSRQEEIVRRFQERLQARRVPSANGHPSK